MKKKEESISLRKYAKTLGITDKSIRNAIASNKIKKGVTYITGIRYGADVLIPRIIKSIADKEYGFIHKNGKIKPGQRSNKITSCIGNLIDKKGADFDGCGLS